MAPPMVFSLLILSGFTLAVPLTSTTVIVDLSPCEQECNEYYEYCNMPGPIYPLPKDKICPGIREACLEDCKTKVPFPIIKAPQASTTQVFLPPPPTPGHPSKPAPPTDTSPPLPPCADTCCGHCQASYEQCLHGQHPEVFCNLDIFKPCYDACSWIDTEPQALLSKRQIEPSDVTNTALVQSSPTEHFYATCDEDVRQCLTDGNSIRSCMTHSTAVDCYDRCPGPRLTSSVDACHAVCDAGYKECTVQKGGPAYCTSIYKSACYSICSEPDPEKREVTEYTNECEHGCNDMKQQCLAHGQPEGHCIELGSDCLAACSPSVEKRDVLDDSQDRSDCQAHCSNVKMPCTYAGFMQDDCNRRQTDCLADCDPGLEKRDVWKDCRDHCYNIRLSCRSSDVSEVECDQIQSDCLEGCSPRIEERAIGSNCGNKCKLKFHSCIAKFGPKSPDCRLSFDGCKAKCGKSKRSEDLNQVPSVVTPPSSIVEIPQCMAPPDPKDAATPEIAKCEDECHADCQQCIEDDAFLWPAKLCHSGEDFCRENCQDDDERKAMRLKQKRTESVEHATTTNVSDCIGECQNDYVNCMRNPILLIGTMLCTPGFTACDNECRWEYGDPPTKPKQKRSTGLELRATPEQRVCYDKCKDLVTQCQTERPSYNDWLLCHNESFKCYKHCDVDY